MALKLFQGFPSVFVCSLLFSTSRLAWLTAYLKLGYAFLQVKDLKARLKGISKNLFFGIGSISVKSPRLARATPWQAQPPLKGDLCVSGDFTARLKPRPTKP